MRSMITIKMMIKMRRSMQPLMMKTIMMKMGMMKQMAIKMLKKMESKKTK